MKPLAVGTFILAACMLARWICGRGLRCLFLISAFQLFSLSAFAASDAALDPENPLAPIAALLGSALAKKIFLWMGVIGAFTKLFAGKLQNFLETAVVAARANPDSKVTRWMDATMSHSAWHVFVFLIDYFTRIKIPRSLAALCLCASVVIFSGCQSPVPGTHFSGALGGVPFVFDGHKQTSAEDVTLEVVSVASRPSVFEGVAPGFTTNYSRLHIGKLSSVNDPEVVGKSYAGQALVTKQFFDGMNQFASKLVEGGVKGAK